MQAYDVITKKKNGLELSKEEIEFMVNGYTNGEIPDYQMSALLMAICLKGMSDKETYDLTITMRDSGDILDLSEIEGVKVDKHSTGGVGDKISLILAPILASLGVTVSKMSGRGLGHTGGTIDKLESIDGLTTSLTKDKFIENVNTVGMAISGQTANLAPADKKLYALRDVTATVDCIPLIASSIMSKKLAVCSDAIVLDVKCGNGAFMKNKEDAVKLAETMVSIGKSAGREMAAIITDMNQPLGTHIGNYLEIIETVDTLKGKGNDDVLKVLYALGAQMLVFAKKAESKEIAIQMIEDSINNGLAYKKFMEFVKAQGGHTTGLGTPRGVAYIKEVSVDKSGYITQIDTEGVGRAVQMLGGGRETKESIIDPFVGVVIAKKIGDYIGKDATVFTVYANDEEKMNEAIIRLKDSIVVLSEKAEEQTETVLEVIV